MRLAAAAATIAACVLVSLAVERAIERTDARISRTSSAPATPIAHVDSGKQTVRTKPGARRRPAGNDSCRWANDNECDDPDIGTGACTQGTDYSDCRAHPRRPRRR